MSGPARRGLQRAAALLLSLLGACAAGELLLAALDLPAPIGSLSFLGPDLEGEQVFLTDPDLFWRLDPDATRYTANALGLRGWLPPREKRPETLRIACVGDSCTFGSGVRYEDTWGLQLERLLRERLPNRDVQTVLGALPGYSSFQSVRLFEEVVAPLRPDVTILDVGPWNDYSAAVGLSDAERWRQLHPRGLARLALPRLRRLLAEALTDEDARREAVLAGWREGRALDGPRVAVDEFRENVEELVRLARAAGSEVVVMVPPHPPSTLETWPQALEYKAVLREVAAAAGAPVLEAPELFEAVPRPAVEPGWTGGSRDDQWPLFSDWVHPTPLGNRLLAGALRDLVLELLSATDPAGPAPTLELRVDAVEPSRLLSTDPGELVVRGQGFRGPDAPLRAWLGDTWLRELEVESDTVLRARAGRVLAPGSAPLVLCTPRGALAATPPLEVAPAELDVTLVPARGADPPQFRMGLRGMPGAEVRAWFATRRRESPAGTRAGTWRLALEPDGRPRGAPDDAPFLFENLELPPYGGRLDADGRLEVGHDLLLDKLRGRTFFLQALVIDPEIREYVSLSTLAAVEVPTE